MMKTTQPQQQTGRRGHSPLLKANVLLHARRLQEKPLPCARKTPHEDCCGYCELYCQEKLTARRYHEIQAWTQSVNTNMAAFTQRPRSPRPRQPKIRYLKYSPPGTADAEEGFRWIRTPNNKAKRSQANSSLLVASLPPAHAAETTSTSKLSSRSIGLDSGLDASIHSTNSSHFSSRSSSNELLNVITIDDAMTRHQGMYHCGDAAPRSSATNLVDSMAEIPEEQIQERLDSIAKFRCSSGQLGQQVDGSASRAMNTIMQTRNVLNNNAHRGLFKEQQFGGPHYLVARKAESKRFRRMNDNLHRIIETDYVANSKLWQKMQQRNAAVVEEAGSGGDGHRPVTAGSGQRPETSVGSRTPHSARHTVDTVDSSRERLLEMIMQIESASESELE